MNHKGNKKCLRTKYQNLYIKERIPDGWDTKKEGKTGLKQ
jgi:hypothetical protein